MPYKTIWEKNGIVWKFFGIVTYEEIEKVNIDFYEDPRSDKCKYQIFDGSRIESIIMQSRDALVTAATDAGASQSIKGVKVALVEGTDEINNLYIVYIDTSKKLNDSWEFKICESLETAKEWVNS